MKNIRKSEALREGYDTYSRFDFSKYSSKLFGMFSGEAKNVRLRFADHLAGVVFDRFGMDIMVAPDGEGHFSFTCELVPSPQFYGWIAAFGKDAEILSPQSVREEMKQRTASIAELYK